MNSLKALQTIEEDNKGNYHGWKRDEKKKYIYIHIFLSLLVMANSF